MAIRGVPRERRAISHAPSASMEMPSLSGGLLRDGVVTCPAHLWQYDVRTGARHDTTGEDLATYPVTMTADTVEITLPSAVPTLSLRQILQAHARDSRP